MRLCQSFREAQRVHSSVALLLQREHQRGRATLRIPGDVAQTPPRVRRLALMSFQAWHAATQFPAPSRLAPSWRLVLPGLAFPFALPTHAIAGFVHCVLCPHLLNAVSASLVPLDAALLAAQSAP